MPLLSRGLYETILTDLLAERIAAGEAEGQSEYDVLRNAEAADRLALHIAIVVERAIEALPERERAKVGTRIARVLIERAVEESNASTLSTERPVDPPQILRAIRGTLPDGSLEPIEAPLIPLLDTTLLTNAPGEPRIGHQLHTEIASADRIDVVMAFIRRSGIQQIIEPLRRHVESGRPLRVLTTVYTGSTEADALLMLAALGAEVRVSYDTTATRLHAKAWLFQRETGFSTAYVGSSNLTHSAQVSGLEWNVRVSAARNRPVIDKIAAVFDSYWENPEFEPFDRERFDKAKQSAVSPRGTIALSPVEIRLDPFQERLLEQVELSRQQGHHRNLLVSATGTGKTVMAAVDYARIRTRLPRARLLFLAHREEILRQSRGTFAHALRDASFGELWVGGERPQHFEHVFASIQSLSTAGLDSLRPDHFDVVIVDEFHHAAAVTYKRVLEHIEPRELLGLTATPERSDGVSVLQWFDGRIAAELRLWDAIDQHRLTPFAYYGIADQLDLREIPWRRGMGYDVDGVTKLITSTDAWARHALHQFQEHVGDVSEARALGFCVSVEHARYMARVFTEHNVNAVAVWADTPDAERAGVLRDLSAKRVNVVFSVDLFNEGVDVPSVDTLLMLRPTDSPLLFLQQLGRGLRKSPEKSVCTVLDFVGQHRKEFRFDRRFQALLGGSRASVIQQVERGFPFLPAGCHMELDRVASERVLESLRNSVPSRWSEKASELRKLDEEHPGIPLSQFLSLAGFDLGDVYRGDRGWSDLREEAGIGVLPGGPHESQLRKACGRLLHIDDPERLARYRAWLSQQSVPDTSAMAPRDRRLLMMLLVQLFDQVAQPETTLEDALSLLWQHPQVRSELVELFEVLSGNVAHVSLVLQGLPEVPLRITARYTRQELLSACGENESVRKKEWREGVRFARAINADLFVFTLDKTSGQFSPTTRYRDYAISRDLVHWESQSGTRAESPTGQRYQQHAARGSHVLLFGRETADDRAFYFLGPATYVSHRGEMPMGVTWRLAHPLPGDLFQAFAAAVA